MFYFVQPQPDCPFPCDVSSKGSNNLTTSGHLLSRAIRTFEEHGRCPKLGACLCPRRSTLSHTYSLQQVDSCSLIRVDRVNRGREIARAIGALIMCALRSELDSVGTRRLFRWLSKLPFIKGAPKRRHKLTWKIRKCTNAYICKLRLVSAGWKNEWKSAVCMFSKLYIYIYSCP